MSKPKQFEVSRAQVDALRLFWQKGYEATSINDLVERLQISRSSLYDTFGGKHRLFLDILDLYRRRTVYYTEQILDSDQPVLVSLKMVFDNVIDGVGAPEGTLGCLMVNSAAELAPSDVEVTTVVKSYDDAMLAILTRTMERGQARGELSRAYPAEQLALLFFNTLQGTRLLVKVGYAKAQLVALRDMCLNSLI